MGGATLNILVILAKRRKNSNTSTMNRDTTRTHPFHKVGNHGLRADACGPNDESILAPLLLPAPLIREAYVGGGDLSDAGSRAHIHVIPRKLLGSKLANTLVEPGKD